MPQILLSWIQVPGLVNVDFADVRAIMANAGSSLMGIGTATGVYYWFFVGVLDCSSIMAHTGSIHGDVIFFNEYLWNVESSNCNQMHNHLDSGPSL